MSKLPECAGHRQGDTVFLSDTGFHFVDGYGSFSKERPYILGHDGSGCPWFLRAPEGNNVYINPETHLKPGVPQVPDVPTREVTVYKYIVIDKPVSGLEVGAHYEVQSVNINGSYLVPSNTYSNAVVAPEKCHPWVQGGTKSVPCRHPSFSLGLDGPVYPEGFQVKPTSNQKAPEPFQIQEAPKRVKKQKEVARELLKYATMMDPYAMLAGGAPRNWYLGLEANDLDIFIRPHRAVSESYMRDTMRRIGIQEVFNKASETAPGVPKKNRFSQKECQKAQIASDQKIKFVLEGTYMGEVVQFIVLEEGSSIGLDYCSRYFDTSINMINMTLNRTTDELVESRSPRFDDSMKLGVIFVQDNGSAYGNGDHLERIHSYFPTVPMVREKYREDVKRNPAKAWELAEDWEDLV